MSIKLFIACFMLSFEFCFAQQVGELTPFLDSLNYNEKVILNAKNEPLIYGHYLDLDGSGGVNSNGIMQGYILNKSTKHLSYLIRPYSDNQGYWTTFYDCNKCTNKALQITDSTYALSMFRVDTGQYYKSSSTWLVYFNSNADTLSTYRMELTNNAEIAKMLFDQKDHVFYLLVDDTCFLADYGALSMLYKVDSTGKLIWKKYMTGGCISKFYNMFQLPNGNLVLGGDILTAKDVKSICRSKFQFQIRNKDGLIQYDNISSDTTDDADFSILYFEMIDPSRFVGLSLPESLRNGLGGSNELIWRLSNYGMKVVLFNDSGKIVNSKNIVDGDKFSGNNYYQYSKVYPMQDKSMVLLGQYINQNYFQLPDTKKQTGVTLAKLDSNLETKWVRQYLFKDYYYDQEIYDLTFTKDSFYLVGSVGESKFAKGKGWYIQTDKYGCVIEGCQLHDAVQELRLNHQQFIFSVYPSPASLETQLAIDHSLDTKALELVIVNLNGQLIQEFKKGSIQNEMWLHTSSYPDGLYYLLLKSNGHLIASTKLAIVH